MIRMSTFVIATLAAVPLVVAAQTANQPGGQASTGTPLDQTTNAPGASTPKTTQTSPDATNPSGSLNTAKDYGTSPSSRSTTNTTTPSAMGTSRATTKGNTTKTGDVPTYPAPAPDGTPTK